MKLLENKIGIASTLLHVLFLRTFKQIFCMDYFELLEGANCIKDFLNALNETPDDMKIVFPVKNPIHISLPIIEIINYLQTSLFALYLQLPNRRMFKSSSVHLT